MASVPSRGGRDAGARGLATSRRVANNMLINATKACQSNIGINQLLQLRLREHPLILT